MTKYKVILVNKDISKPNKSVEVKGISTDNAMKIAEAFNKGYDALKAIRIKTKKSIKQELNESVELMWDAISAHNEEIFLEQKEAFKDTVESIRKQMNAYEWSMTKKFIPEIPSF